MAVFVFVIVNVGKVTTIIFGIYTYLLLRASSSCKCLMEREIKIFVRCGAEDISISSQRLTLAPQRVEQTDVEGGAITDYDYSYYAHPQNGKKSL